MVAHSPALTEAKARPQRAATPRYRFLGTLGMLTSAFLLLSYFPAGLDQDGTSRLGSFLGLIFTFGWYANVLGLRLLDAAGKRLPGKILLTIPLFTIPLAMGNQFYGMFAPGHTDALVIITDIAWPLSMLTMLITGIVVAIIGGLRGPARFVPLLCGLWLPIGIVLINTAGAAVGQVISGIHVTIGWLLLGYVIRNGGGFDKRG